MAFQSVPETAEVVIRAVCNNVDVTNTFYGRKTGGYTLSDVQALTIAVYDNWAGLIAPHMPVAYILNGATGRGLELLNDVEYIHTPGAVAGQSATNPTPNNVCLAIKRSSSFTGRSARGRVYVGPIPVGHLATDENFVGATWAANIVAGLEDMRDDMSAAGWQEVIVSRYSSGVKRATGVTFAVVSYNNTDLRVDSRRDRLPGN